MASFNLRIFLRIAFLFILPFSSATLADDQPGEGLNILYLSSYTAELPTERLLRNGMEQVLSFDTGQNHIVSEFLGRPYTGPDYQQRFIRDVRAKYSSIDFDVVISRGAVVSRLLAVHGDLFPDARLIYLENKPGQAPYGRGTMVAWYPEYAQVLRDGLQMTGADRLLIVAETRDEMGRERVQSVKQALAELEVSLPVAWRINTRLALLEYELAQLTPDTLVFYLPKFSDGEGHRMSPYNIAKRLSAVSGAPIISAWNAIVGAGVVGGAGLSLEQIGYEAGRLAAGTFEPSEEGSQRYMRYLYDWQQLQKWGFRPPSAAEDIQFINEPIDLYSSYRWQIRTGIVFIAVLLVALFLLWRAWRAGHAAQRALAEQRSELEERVIQRTEELHDSRQRLLLLLKASGDGLIGLDTEGRVSFVNPAALSMLDWPEDALIGQKLHETVQPHCGGCQSGAETHCHILRTLRTGAVERSDQERFRRRDGELFAVEYIATPVDVDGELSGAVLSFRDITERRQAEQEVERLATTDTLTGLANRHSFHRYLQSVAEARGAERPGVLLLDLDNFKPVNDTWGHPGGDQVLRVIAQRLQAQCHQDDVVARLGGDEFAILIRTGVSLTKLEQLAELLIDQVCQPIDLSGAQVRVGVSIGIAIYHQTESVVELIARADKALYAAKEGGKNTWRRADNEAKLSRLPG